jgi:hypothetical protein
MGCSSHSRLPQRHHTRGRNAFLELSIEHQHLNINDSNVIAVATWIASQPFSKCLSANTPTSNPDVIEA